MKSILVIGTGGTIAAAEGDEGLEPAYNADVLIEQIPEVKDICNISTLQLMNIDSTNIQPQHWTKISEAIKEKYDEYDGFVVAHGTDTLAYTASHLSYVIQNNKKTIVLTGSQKPIMAEGTDARKNLADAIRFACEETGGVYVVFGGLVINGCRASKTRTKSFKAFESINYPHAAEIIGDRIVYNPDYTFPGFDDGIKYYPDIADDVVLIKLMPGAKSGMFDFIRGKYRGLVIESFGNGGVPFLGDDSILNKVVELTKSGVIVVVTTQCLFEGGNLALYQVGQKLLKNGVIPANDMTTEAAVTKLMWILGITGDYDEVKRMFMKPVNYDIQI